MIGIAVVGLLIGFAVLVVAVVVIVGVLSSGDDEDHVSTDWLEARIRDRRD